MLHSKRGHCSAKQSPAVKSSPAHCNYRKVECTCSGVSDSLRPHGLWPTGLLHPRNFLGKSTAVGCHFLLQGIFPTWGSNPCLLHCRQILYQLRRKWQPTPVFLPGESHGPRSLVGCSPWSHWESDTTEQLHFHFSLSCIGEGNGNPLQCSCLENPRDGGAWGAAV